VSQPLWRQNLPAIGIGLLDVFLIGLGAGVPVLAILFGLGVGWWAARSALAGSPPEADIPREALRALAFSALALAAVSFLVLLVLWGPAALTAFDPAVSASEWGIPLILYSSGASKIGWLVLMLVVSPVLQFMAVMTGGVLRFAIRPGRKAASR